MARATRTSGKRGASADDLRCVALSLSGTTSAPHFDRTAFKVKRTYATLAADGLTANLLLQPGTQEMKCLTAPKAFARVNGAWGAKGWTSVTLAAIGRDELEALLAEAWEAGVRPANRTR